MPDQKPDQKPDQGSKANGPDLFEVLVDVYGSDPMHHKGDFLTSADTPYDLNWAAEVGAVRRLPADEARNVREAGLESATQPVGPDMKVDQDVQRNARDAAGAPRPDDQPGANTGPARQP